MSRETWEQSYKNPWQYKVCWSSGMEQTHEKPFLHSQPWLGCLYCLEFQWVCCNTAHESGNTQCPAKCWLCPCCHTSLTSLLRCQDPPRPPPFPFQAVAPMTCYYEWALQAHTLGLVPILTGNAFQASWLEHNLHWNAQELLFSSSKFAAQMVP